MSRRQNSNDPVEEVRASDRSEDASHPVRPLRVFAVLALTGGLLLAFIAAVPSGHLQVTESLALNFISVEQLQGGGQPEYADIGHILAAHSQQVEVESQEGSPSRDAGDAPVPEPVIARPRPSRVAGKDADEIAQILRRIENPQALRPFFQALAEHSDEEVVRVVHYGDSQIEGDRISDFLRQRLQQRYGGCGVGLVPIFDPMPVRVSVFQEASGDWHYYVPYGRLDESIPHDRFGIMGAIYRYQPYPPVEPAGSDATPLEALSLEPAAPSATASTRPERTPGPQSARVKEHETGRGSSPARPAHQPGPAPAKEDADAQPSAPAIDSQAWVKVKRSKLALPTARRFEVVRLLVGDIEEPVPVVWEADGETRQERLERSHAFRVYGHRFKEPVADFSLHFLSGPSPDLYGMALDCPNGVAVDNVPLRGASGIFVHRWSQQAIRRQMEQLNVGLIIWQFGVNVVPYLEDNYEFYRRNLKRSLELLKQAYPEASILVVGISDMSHKDEAGYYRTRANVEGIRDAQRRAALDTGVAFWDLHEAMGGRNSMPSWVKENLATPDYTHFSPQGARIVARMLYNALRASQEEVFPEDTPHDKDPIGADKSRSAD
ncbi:MAG TPA: GDSL-type esterase/lipase family protein [Acidobacteriota bacterium]|nr:GDSL-type esterase/lipase family protein [Acidobacteriota bacterium]